MLFSRAKNESGTLKAEMNKKHPYYCFYPSSTPKDGQTAGDQSMYSFQKENMRDVARDGLMIKFKLRGTSMSLAFAKKSDADEFCNTMN